MCFITTSTAVWANERTRLLRVVARTSATTAKTRPWRDPQPVGEGEVEVAVPLAGHLGDPAPLVQVRLGRAAPPAACGPTARTCSSSRRWSTASVRPTSRTRWSEVWVCAISPAGISQRPASRTRTSRSASSGVSGPQEVSVAPPDAAATPGPSGPADQPAALPGPARRRRRPPPDGQHHQRPGDQQYDRPQPAPDRSSTARRGNAPVGPVADSRRQRTVFRACHLRCMTGRVTAGAVTFPERRRVGARRDAPDGGFRRRDASRRRSRPPGREMDPVPT